MEEASDSDSEDSEGSMRDGWPTMCYDVPQQAPLEWNEVNDFAKNFVNVRRNWRLASNDSQARESPNEKQPRMEMDAKVGYKMLFSN